MTSTSDKHPAPPRLHFSLAPEPSRLLRARERIRDYLTLYSSDQTVVNDLVLAVEEACTNAIRHSGSDQAIELLLETEAGTIQAIVKDQGRGFDVGAFDSERTPDPLLDHGRGLFLMARLCDELVLSRDGGLEVRLVKRAGLIDGGREVGFERALLPSGDGRASTNRRRALLDEIGEGFDALDWEYRYVYVNAVSLRRMGKSLDELLGRTPWEVFPALEGSQLLKAYREAMELGRPAVIEHRSVVDGQWLEARVYPTTMGASCYYRGIDERKATERSLEHSRRRTELLEWVAGSLLATDDPQGLVEELCRRVMTELDCQAFFNFLVDEQAGRLHLNACAGIPAAEAERIEWLDYGVAVCGCAAQQAERIVAEEIPTTPDVRTELVASYGITAYAAHPLMVQGKVLGTLSFGTRTRMHFSDEDLDLMKAVADHVAMAVHHQHAEQATRAAEERERYLADVVETASVPFALRRPDGALVLFNQAFADLVGYARSELEEGAETLAVSITPPDWWQLEAPLLAAAVAQRQPVRYEKEYLRKDGSRVPVEVFAQPVFDDAGELLQYHSFITDISERKRAEEDSTRQLEAQARRHALDQSLARIHRLVYATLQGDEIMERALQEAAQVLASDAASIETLDAQGWVIRYQSGFASPQIGRHLSAAEAAVAVRAASLGEPLGVGDLLTEGESACLSGQELRAVLAVPLVLRGTASACLLWHNRRPRAFAPEELDYARTLGAVVSLALANARLADDEAEPTVDQAAWNGPSRLLRRLQAHRWRVLAGALALEGAVLAALGAAPTRHILGLPGSIVALIAVVTGALAGPAAGALAAAGGGVAFFFTVGGQGSKSADWTILASAALWIGAGAMAGYLSRQLRLQSASRRASALALARADAARQVQLTEQRRIEGLVAELQAERDDLSQRAALADSLNAINRLMLSSLETPTIMQLALDEGVRALSGDAGTIEMRKGAEWIVRYKNGLLDVAVGTRLSDAEAPVAASIERSGQPRVLADALAEPEMNGAFLRTHGLRFALGVPLLSQQTVVGCLFFYGAESRLLTDAEIDFARKLGATLSLAVENARLYEEQQRIAVTLQENLVHELPMLAGPPHIRPSQPCANTSPAISAAASSCMAGLACEGRPVTASPAVTSAAVACWPHPARPRRLVRSIATEECADVGSGR